MTKETIADPVEPAELNAAWDKVMSSNQQGLRVTIDDVTAWTEWDGRKAESTRAELIREIIRLRAELAEVTRISHVYRNEAERLGSKLPSSAVETTAPLTAERIAKEFRARANDSKIGSNFVSGRLKGVNVYNALHWVADEVLRIFDSPLEPRETTVFLTEDQANGIATDTVQNVCELPGYTSPEDQPALVSCTVTELHHSVMLAIETFNARAPEEPRETSRDDAVDAAKWRALRNCARITAMGSAGLTQPHNINDPYAHLTLNFWTGADFDGDPGPAYAREWLDKFVTKALRASSPEEPSADGLTKVRDRTANVALTCSGACRYSNGVLIADPACDTHGSAQKAEEPELCPRCQQSMPGGVALHTDHCPQVKASEPTFQTPQFAGFAFRHWSKDPLVPYKGCQCDTCLADN